MSCNRRNLNHISSHEYPDHTLPSFSSDHPSHSANSDGCDNLYIGISPSAAADYQCSPEIEAHNIIINHLPSTLVLPADSALNHNIDHASNSYLNDQYYYSCCSSDDRAYSSADIAHLHHFISKALPHIDDDLTLLHNNFHLNIPAASDQIVASAEDERHMGCHREDQVQNVDDISFLSASCENDNIVDQLVHGASAAGLNIGRSAKSIDTHDDHGTNYLDDDRLQQLLPANNNMAGSTNCSHSLYGRPSSPETAGIPRPQPPRPCCSTQLHGAANGDLRPHPQFEGGGHHQAEGNTCTPSGDHSYILSEGASHCTITSSSILIAAGASASDARCVTNLQGCTSDLEEVLDILLEQVESAASCSAPHRPSYLMNQYDLAINVVASSDTASCVPSSGQRAAASASCDESSFVGRAQSLIASNSCTKDDAATEASWIIRKTDDPKNIGQINILHSQGQEYTTASIWQDNDREHTVRAFWDLPMPASTQDQDGRASWHCSEHQRNDYDIVVEDATRTSCQQKTEVAIKKIRVICQQGDNTNSHEVLAKTASTFRADQLLGQQPSGMELPTNDTNMKSCVMSSKTSTTANSRKAAWIGPTLMDVHKALQRKSHTIGCSGNGNLGLGGGSVMTTTESSTSNSNSSYSSAVISNPHLDHHNAVGQQLADDIQGQPGAASVDNNQGDKTSFLTDEVALLCKDEVEQAHELVDSWRLQKRAGGRAGPSYRVRVSSEEEAARDGYRWRKYGQKTIKNSPFPRCYYKCTSGKCQVKKQVERCTNQSKTFLVTYEGLHDHSRPDVCHMCASSSNFGHSHCPSTI
ncbi:hypothetical protein GOP47_0012131 [Adiantum capillus-veneris]|uniref:WRKY domain-containing protein n=1 Tax=Adiantum capillus-veneris TaxID=13818 RepID=A0A9D4ZG82_ADICA|nr:hypothetical protein GOP47_0012131 [Adiantum capillus-veneris]